jgi:PPOX class probable F420-dependent enzyme
VALSEQVRAFLDEPRFAVLATVNPDGTAQQTVMWYKLDGDRIVMNTARGRWKDHNLRRDRRVSLCIEDGYRFVTISGVVELDDDQATAQADIRELAIRYYGLARAEQMVRDQFSKQERIAMRLPLDRVMTRGFDDEG